MRHVAFEQETSTVLLIAKKISGQMAFWAFCVQLWQLVENLSSLQSETT